MKEDTAYQTISETSKLINIPSHVLRFWESKFDLLNPKIGVGGRRYYAPHDIENLKQIKTLLYEKGLTINGAIKHLKSTNQKDLTSYNSDQLIEKIDQIITNVNKIKSIINNY